MKQESVKESERETEIPVALLSCHPYKTDAGHQSVDGRRIDVKRDERREG